MITIVKRPEKFSPVGNNVIWQIKSDNPNIVYFRVKLIDDTSTSVINQLDYWKTPQNPTGTYFNLSTLLTSAVNW